MASSSSSPSDKPRRMVGTSLKMYFDLPRTASYVSSVAALAPLASTQQLDLFLIPDFLNILPARDALQGTPVLLGAQDAFWEDAGAYTGEVSPRSLAQAGVQIVELGHAERRALFGETDEQVARKAAAAVRHGLIPLVCVGERSHGRIASEAVGLAVREVSPQVRIVLDALPRDAEVILAYEPVWAIGAAEPADPDHVVNVAQALREIVRATRRTGQTRILYGGSAGPGTFARLKDAMDGLFLGRFAHDVENLKKVIVEVGTA